LLAKSGVVELEARLGGGIDAPVAPAPEAVDADAIRSVERGADLEGISVFKRTERRAARERADMAARRHVAEEQERLTEIAAQAQEAPDVSWTELQTRRVKLDADIASETARQRDKAQGEAREQQKQLDAAWDSLQRNEPETVIASLEQAFADNEAPASPVRLPRRSRDGDRALWPSRCDP
jgi:hypothetical protein